MRAASTDQGRAARVCALLFASFIGGCGRVGLEPPPGATVPDTAETPGSAPVDAASGADAAPITDAAPTTDAASSDATASPWPVIVRIVNVGKRSVAFPSPLVASCGFEVSVHAVDDDQWIETSLSAGDTWCPCDRCLSAGRRICTTVDFFCEGSPLLLAAGDHLDLPWDGQLAGTRPVPPESVCGGCNAWDMITPGRYVFRVTPLSRPAEVEVSLPSATGVIEILMSGD